MKTPLMRLVVVFPLVVQTSFAQTYQGPAVGSVLSGGTVNTGTLFKTTEIGTPKERGTRNVVTPYKEPYDILILERNESYSIQYMLRIKSRKSNSTENSPSILLKSFKGL